MRGLLDARQQCSRSFARSGGDEDDKTEMTLATTIEARIRCGGRASWQCEDVGRDSSVACAKLWRSGLGLGLGRGCQGRSWLQVVESRSSVVIGELYPGETIHDGLAAVYQRFHVVLYGKMRQ